MSASGDSAKSTDKSIERSKYFPGRKSQTVQPAKRPHADVANTSAEEMQLIMSELSEIKAEIKETIKKADLTALVTELVDARVQKTEDKFNDKMKQMETKYGKLKDDYDQLNVRHNALKETLAKNQGETRELKAMAETAFSMAQSAEGKANYNEQYSRKSNIKIYGVKENEKEKTADRVIELLESEVEVNLKKEEIVAVHRIPGKKGETRPILLKVQNTEVKSRIMKKRSDFKKKVVGCRLADDVTKLNSDLIQRLNLQEGIEQAWYFNGSVYGSVIQGENKFERVQFDIHDNLREKIKKHAKAKAKAK